MSDAETDNQDIGLSRLGQRKAMRVWLVEGVIATVFVCLTTGTFQTGYAIALGCSNLEIGILSGIPSVVGLLQLTAPVLMRYFPSRRIFVSTLLFAGRMVWLPMLLIPFVLPNSQRAWIPVFLLLTLLSSALQSTMAATWADWMSDVVPLDVRGRYFGLRNLLCGATGMVTAILGGLYFDHATHYHHFSKLYVSSLLFAFGLIFAFGSFLCERASPDVPPKPDESHRSILELLRTPLKDPKFRGVLNFTLANVACQTITGQFFLVYMIKWLKMSYGPIQLILAVGSLVSFASMPVLGYLVDKYGNKPILVLSCILCVAGPFLWCFTVRDPYPGLWAIHGSHLLISNSKLMIILIQLLSGAGWAGVAIAQFNIIVNSAPAQDRTSYIGANSTLAGLMGGICPLIGGVLLTWFRTLHYPMFWMIRGEFHLLFFIAGLMRFLMVAYALRLDEPESRSARYVLGQLRAARPVGSFAAIVQLGRSGDSRTRARAAEQLGRLKTPVAVEELVKAMDDVSLPVREQAVASLGEIGDARAVHSLMNKLSDLSSGIAPEAALALGKIGDMSALPALAAVIQLGGPSPRRLAAIEALGRLNDRRVPEILAPLVAERDSSVRVAAVKALAGLPEAMRSDAVVTALLDQWHTELDATVLPALADALAASGRAELAPLLCNGFDRVVSPLVKREILNAIGSLLGGQDSFYAYLVLDGAARDETARKILTSLQKTYRKPGPAGNARAAVRLRQALDDYLNSQYDRAASNLYKVATSIKAAASPGLSVMEAINSRAERSLAISAEEVLLDIFVLRLLVGSR